jgi:hypothetical protein
VLGDDEKWRREKPPIEMLQAFEKCLKKTFGADQTEVCRRAVTVTFDKNYYPEDHEGKVLSIDAVPALEAGKEVYEIPDKVTGKWVKTNPKKHMEQATAKNDELDGCWVPLVKMVKGWNRANGKPIKPSFLVEVMAEGLVEAPFSTYPNEVRNLFAAMEANVGSSWPDPAGLGPPVSDQMHSGVGHCRAQGITGGATQGGGSDARRRDRPTGRCATYLAGSTWRLFSSVLGQILI